MNISASINSILLIYWFWSIHAEELVHCFSIALANTGFHSSNLSYCDGAPRIGNRSQGARRSGIHRDRMITARWPGSP